MVVVETVVVIVSYLITAVANYFL